MVIISQRHALSVGVLKAPVIIVLTVWVLDSYAESVLYLSTGATHFTVLRCVSVLSHCNRPILTRRRQLWTENSYFQKVNLKDLGLRIQLGHKAGEICWNRGRVAGDNFVVLDVNGIHEVGVDFCDCEKSKPEFIQLLRFGWFMASVDRPKTAATFSVLKHFHLLNFKSKASLFEFYNTLAWLTDNTGLSTPKVYKSAPSHFSQFKCSVHTTGLVLFFLNYCSGILTYEDAEKGNERIRSPWHCGN
jgi:CxC2 like cysteine cluster associated with KDZ transposases